MTLDNIFDNSPRRRWWLLQKALEHASLEEALKIAQAADEFITSEMKMCQAAAGAKSAAGAAASRSQPGTNIEYPGADQRRPDQPDEPPAPGAASSVRCGRTRAGERPAATDLRNDAAPEPATAEAPAAAEAAAAPNADQGCSADGKPEACDAGLAVWASVDDVVRYLRQRDVVVVANGENSFLVNGRFREDLNALVARANRLRERQGKLPFDLIPSVFA